MKVILSAVIAFISLFGILNYQGYTGIAQNKKETEKLTGQPSSDFEKAVEIIKKYEGLHQPKHWPLIGYGHLVKPGEKYSRSKALNEKEADALLRKDLLKNCSVFRSFGPDSLILGVLAYNIGSGATMRSSVVKKLKAGDRDIYDNYVAHSRYKGKVHPKIKERRIEEFETLFLKETKNSAHENIIKESGFNSMISEETAFIMPKHGIEFVKQTHIPSIITQHAI